MRSRLLPTRSLVAALVAGVLATAGARAADDPSKVPADPPKHPVLDPHYGDVLFEFYQGRYFPAITKLEVSQHFDRMQHHADEAEILRGGLLLSYGLHKQAAEVFEALLARGAPPSVRDRAWYFLAKIRYQRGLMPDAAAALARIEHVLPAPLEDDRKLLQANVAMALGDNAGASRILAPAAGLKGADLYARYNLGVALVRDGDVAHGTQMLDELGRQTMPDEETRALRDKANVALGFAALKSGQPQEARAYLERVRLQGLQANAALLGFGWAADALNDPKLALVPWIELAGRDASDPAVLEAQLAVPYAYAKLHADAQALQRYETAIANFETEDANIDATIAAIRQGKLVEGLMGRNPGEEMGWFQTFRDLPLMPHARLLTPVIAGNEFQEAFKNYRDLQFLAHNLTEWHDNLGVFGDMLATRRQGFAERLPKIREQQQASGLNIAQLQQRSDANAADLKKAEDAADGTAFADANERELQQRLARVTDTLGKLPADADTSLADARDRLRRVAGALAWQLAHEYPARVWTAKKGQKQTEDALAAA
ncbi:MAG TPA: tetratricopeptide repeat protein, partial [Burkholderiaceae bacterium]|nr:tetratricopeptide repeat protein [Burkholderiaceae bacterium]